MSDPSSLNQLTIALSQTQPIKRGEFAGTNGGNTESFENVMARERQAPAKDHNGTGPKRSDKDGNSKEISQPSDRPVTNKPAADKADSTPVTNAAQQDDTPANVGDIEVDTAGLEQAQQPEINPKSVDEGANFFRQLELGLGQSLPLSTSPEFIGPPLPVEGGKDATTNNALLTSGITSELPSISATHSSLDTVVNSSNQTKESATTTLLAETQTVAKLAPLDDGLNPAISKTPAPANVTSIDNIKPGREPNATIKPAAGMPTETSQIVEERADILNPVGREENTRPHNTNNIHDIQPEQQGTRRIAEGFSLLGNPAVGGRGLGLSRGDSIATSSVDTAADKLSPSVPTQEANPLIKLSNGGSDSSWVQQFHQVSQAAESAKTPATQLQLPLSLHNPKWFAAVADRVSWLASRAVQAAEIHLDPPELGPLQVRIAVNQDQASVNFVSHQAAVREVLDAQLMRLKELFSNEGMQLIDVNVSDRHQQGQHASEQRGHSQAGDPEHDSETQRTVPINHINSWVDYYV